MMATDTITSPTTNSTTMTTAAPAVGKSINGVEFLIRFPPFPPPAEGKTVIPFKDFTERGIVVEPSGDDNETEVDAFGIPTLIMPNAHNTDWCKTNTKRQGLSGNQRGGKRGKKKKKSGNALGSNLSNSNWMEWWEESTYRVNTSYDPRLEAYERLYQGASDFKRGRPWPLAVKQAGPVFIWGEFLRFAGIPLNGEGGTIKPEAVQQENNGNHDDSDLDDDSDEDDTLHPTNMTSTDIAFKNQQKAEAFLKDPALMLKIFFSSYARDRGIIWTEINLVQAPLLIRFFIQFLVDNNILPKREMNAIKHESTHRVIDLALKELPLTAKLAKAWPDHFSLACRDCWGAKVVLFRPGSPMSEVAEEGPASEPTKESVTVADSTMPSWNAWTNDSTNNATADGWGGSTDNTGWGDSIEESGWQNPTVGTGGAGDGTGEVAEGESTWTSEVVNDFLKGISNPNANTWESSKPPNFFPLLGPTALPVTHTTGIVESSVRRIKAIHPPSPDVSKFPVVKDLSPDAVEGTLERTFGTIVFEPWINWNNGEDNFMSSPVILETSRGVVKAHAEGSTTGLGNLPPFDPYKEDISVLVSPEILDYFSVGMGCACTWVQIARAEDLPEGQDDKAKPKKKKGKKPKTERYWYIEELLQTIPSFYTYQS